MRRRDASRRTFLQATAGVVAAAPFVSRMARADAATRKFDPSFGTATEAVAALRGGVISSRELTEHVFARIHKHNPKINAFVTLIEEQALVRARQTDEQRARKQAMGALHGLPVLIKDAFETAGIRTTCGSKSLENYIPKQDAEVVARLKQAGAIVVGKTNLSEFTADGQSYNDIAGTTNNPWDVTRTPGGSTGGGAAALAAGFGFLEVGSDIAGSIRTPSHFCGVYGHKPTLEIVPLAGHIPPLPGVPTGPSLLNVAGPIARSAADLLLELRVLAGPMGDEARAYRWSPPKARKSSLRDYKIGVVLNDPFCPVDGEVEKVLASAVTKLRKGGAQLTEGWPRGFDPRASLENYQFLLSSIVMSDVPQPVIDGMRKAVEGGNRDPYFLGATAAYRDWDAQNQQRLRTQAVWRDYFKSFDAFIAPACFVAAFRHDHSPDMFARVIATASGARRYLDLTGWMAPASLTGCPATVVPVGRTDGGLPVGLQIIGPYMEDATPIDIAMKMAEVFGGFVAPPGYAL
jgi:amidase